MPPTAANYSPNVTVMRGKEEDGYPWLAKHFDVDVISSAAKRRPTLLNINGSLWLSPDDARTAEESIRTVLAIAKSKGIQALVLTPLGCGAFGHPLPS